MYIVYNKTSSTLVTRDGVSIDPGKIKTFKFLTREILAWQEKGYVTYTQEGSGVEIPQNPVIQGGGSL